MEVKSVSVEKYTKEHFSKYLDDETITEICYNGDDLIWVLDNKSIWRPEKTALNYEKASAFTQAVAAFKKAEIHLSVCRLGFCKGFLVPICVIFLPPP